MDSLRRGEEGGRAAHSPGPARGLDSVTGASESGGPRVEAARGESGSALRRPIAARRHESAEDAEPNMSNERSGAT